MKRRVLIYTGGLDRLALALGYGLPMTPEGKAAVNAALDDLIDHGMITRLADTPDGLPRYAMDDRHVREVLADHDRRHPDG